MPRSIIQALDTIPQQYLAHSLATVSGLTLTGGEVGSSAWRGAAFRFDGWKMAA